MPRSADALRRAPEQERSRRRVAAILDAAQALVAERGLAPVTMTDVAARAGMSLTALYRYFPDRAAVVRALALRALEEDRGLVSSGADQVRDGTVEAAVRRLVDVYRDRERQPFRTAMRAAIAADRDLALADLADTRANVAALADAVSARTGRTDRAAVERELLLALHLAGGAVALADLVGDDEGEALVDAYVRMVTALLIGQGATPAPR